jgi:microcin C transport system substrate-binding protein
MIDRGFFQPYFPSVNLQFSWHSDFIDSTFNRAGVMDPAIDYLIEGINARQQDAEALLHWGRALDRVLLWNHFIIPCWYSSHFRLAYRNTLRRPEVLPTYSFAFDAWWMEP